MAELFSLDATSLYLFDASGTNLRRVAAAGHRSEYSRHFPAVSVKPELLQHIKDAHATFISAQGLPLPAGFCDAQIKERNATAYIVIPGAKDPGVRGPALGNAH